MIAPHRWPTATALPVSLLLIAFTLPLAPQNAADLWPVTVSVTDAKGTPVNDLRREDFSLVDNGQPLEIQRLSHDDVPLTIGILADVSGSGSQIKALKKQKDVIAAFLSRLLRPTDRVFLVTFDEDVRLAVDLTRSIDDLRNAIDQMKPLTHAERLELRKHTDQAPNRLGETCNTAEPTGVLPRPLKSVFPCNSATWDGIFFTANLKLKALSGRKALIVLSHGIDGGSAHGVAQAIEAAQSANTVVYTIRPVDTHIKSNTDPARLASANALDRMAEETGGKQLTTLRDPKTVFAEIEKDLRSLYVLSVAAPKETSDSKPHSLEVKVSKPGTRVRTRKAY